MGQARIYGAYAMTQGCAAHLKVTKDRLHGSVPIFTVFVTSHSAATRGGTDQEKCKEPRLKRMATEEKAE